MLGSRSRRSFEKGTGDCGESARCYAMRSSCTTKDASSGVAAERSSLFVNNNVSGNITLEAPDRTFTLGVFAFFKLAAAERSFLEQSWIFLSLEMSFHGKGAYCGKSVLDLIGRFCARGELATV